MKWQRLLDLQKEIEIDYKWTNADYIHSMNYEELAGFLSKIVAYTAPCMIDGGNCKWEDYPTHDKGCKDCFLEWLKSEVGQKN